MTVKKSNKEKPDFVIPQLKQKIAVNSLKLTEKQKKFLSIAFDENTKLMFIAALQFHKNIYGCIFGLKIAKCL